MAFIGYIDIVQTPRTEKQCCVICSTKLHPSSELCDQCTLKNVYCPACHLEFWTTEGLLNHGDEKHFVCWACEKMFITSDEYAKHKQSEHHYCRQCDKLFSSQQTLEQHRISSVHTPRLIACPGKSCHKKFTSLSALILHVEEGACSSGIARKDVNAFVKQYAKQNPITNPAQRATTHDGTTHPSKPKYSAIDDNWDPWNGHAYQCGLCKREFGSLKALHQHMRSPRHYHEETYHCPIFGCNVQFITLSALCQHVERGSCGVDQPKVLEDVMDYLERGMRSTAL